MEDGVDLDIDDEDFDDEGIEDDQVMNDGDPEKEEPKLEEETKGNRSGGEPHTHPEESKDIELGTDE